MINRKRSGFTIVEIMIVIVFIGIIISLSLSMFITTLNAQKSSYDEYDVQNKLRIMGMELDDMINKASAVFALPDPLPNDITGASSDLDPEWAYYGISEDGTQLIKYTPTGGSPTHTKTVLVDGGNITFEMEFNNCLDTSGNPVSDEFVGYTVKVLKDGVDTGYSIKTELEAKNSQQVVFRGFPAKSIAVRADDALSATQSIIFVHFVLDCSRSMTYNINPSSSSVFEMRMDVLKRALKEIIQKYAAEENVNLVFYPFSTTANYPNCGKSDQHLEPTWAAVEEEHPIYSKNSNAFGEFLYDSNSRKFETLNMTDSTVVDSAVNKLNCVDNTNIGDGMRRVNEKIDVINNEYKTAYYNSGVTSSKTYNIYHYVILLTDGVPTTTCVKYNKNTGKGTDYPGKGNIYIENYEYEYIDNDYMKKGQYIYENMPSKVVTNQIWTTAMTYINVPTHYRQRINGMIDKMGADLSSKTNQIYVIGFSPNAFDLSMIDDLANSCQITDPTHVIKFSDGGNKDLSAVFNKIKDEIMANVWMMKGPDIK